MKSPKEKTPLTQKDAFVISHVFDADIKTVYEMWRDPDCFSRWLGPAGAQMSFVSIGVKEGGVSQWSMTTEDGKTKYGQLHFKKINLNRLLVYVQNFCDQEGKFTKAPFSATYPDYLLTIVDFVNQDMNKTRVTLRWEIIGQAKEIERQTFLEMKPIMESGWGASFSKLASLLI